MTLLEFIESELKIGLTIFGITTAILVIWALVYLIKRKF